jgi:hypothetical protein
MPKNDELPTILWVSDAWNFPTGYFVLGISQN